MKESMLETNHGKQTIGEIIQTLIYINYRYNREIAPDISPDRWKCVFGENVVEFEKAYQAEKEAQNG